MPKSPVRPWQPDSNKLASGKPGAVHDEQPAGTRPVLVMVAAAGGGIRASFWTSLLLSRLAVQVPDFRRQLFLASSVSGGSLGFGVFGALLRDRPPACKVGLEPCAAAFHKSDFLAPILAAMLSRSVLPFPTPPASNVLEYAWEQTWQRILAPDAADRPEAADSAAHQPAPGSFAMGFDKLWSGPGWLPALLLKTTSATGGDRIPVSNLRTADRLRPIGPCTANIAEHLDLTLSTAVNASARFPFLEHPGWFAPGASNARAETKVR